MTQSTSIVLPHTLIFAVIILLKYGLGKRICHIGKDYIRLDTLGNNLKLIEHYTIRI
jgi:hypothetical protein